MATEKPAYEPTTEFGKRNPHLAALVPDAIENAVDALLSDKFEAFLDRRCERAYYKYQTFRTDVQEGIGEVAGVLFRVAKYAYEKFHIHDLVFGVYHLALHHSTVDAVDAVEGSRVDDPALIDYLIQQQQQQQQQQHGGAVEGSRVDDPALIDYLIQQQQQQQQQQQEQEQQHGGAVEGSRVDDPALIDYLIQATDAAAAAYFPSRKELCEAAGIADADLGAAAAVATAADTAAAAYCPSRKELRQQATKMLTYVLLLLLLLLQATDAAAAAYCPSRKELCEAAGITDADLLLLEPQTTTTRPAYAVWVDAPNKRLVWGFRGTTDLNDMLTDACASCEPYMDGYAHWGMLQAAQWFAENELARVRGFLNQHPGYELLLVGHSLGAGTAAMLAHLIKHDPEAGKVMAGVKFSAVGVATPAVLTEALAAGCSDYVTSVVLMHDVVPRFSIHNVFAMKEEMDATKWGDILAGTLKDWAVPDVIENSATYKRLAASSKKHARSMRGAVAQWWLGMSSWTVSMLHFYGILKPNPAAKQDGKGPATNMKQAAAATAEAARAAMGDAQVVADAVGGVQESLANVAKEDVHEVFAPGRLFFIKRLDKYKGRAKYGNMTHRCALCEDDSCIPTPHSEHDHAAADTSAASSEAAATAAGAAAAADAKIAAGTGGSAGSTAAAAAEQSGKQADAKTVQEFYPGAQFELIEAAPQQRFKRIVLRETCLMDHLCGGYVQGLDYALNKAKGK
uniref:Fungal lipase-type domain-containing protein n=1 Tax=Tetradesmus obliquus TaxID=3088 RepID=A0A383WJQ1_TETOB|eukprot:jgi/Sobl393_1/12021/SZX77685.1